MKKIIKISSLGLVAILASCGKNVATPLRKITPQDALIVAKSMVQNRIIERAKLFDKNKEESKNLLLSNYLFPFNTTKLSADIEIHGLYDADMKTLEGETILKRYDETIIKKHVFFDMDNAFAHTRFEMTNKTDSPMKTSYPVTDTYVFFVENEDQTMIEDEITGEKRERTKYEKEGTFCRLLNFDNTIKIRLDGIHNNAMNPTRANFMQQLAHLCFADDESILDTDGIASGNYLNISHIVQSGLTNVTANWSILDLINNTITGSDPFDVTDEIISMQQWFNFDLDDTIIKFEDLRNAMLDLEDEGSYFNYTFKSNDASNLALEADARRNATNTESGQTETGYQKEATSFTFRDLYLADSHFAIENNINYTVEGTGDPLGHLILNVSGDQTINYRTSENDGVPTDWREYTPMVN